MQDLIASILRLGSDELASEEAACAALVRLRFPRGVAKLCRCGARCARRLALVECADGHRFTILVDTPFATKRRPSIRALFLAIRAFALSPRSVSALEIARDVGASHSTIWRHLHTLRALLPAATALPTKTAAVVQMCGRRSKQARPAWARVGAATAMTRELEPDANAPSDGERLLGENIRVVLTCTFRGVTASWLQRYLDEARARLCWRVDLASLLLQRILTDQSALPFRLVADRAPCTLHLSSEQT
jgi:hypothetical protein